MQSAAGPSSSTDDIKTVNVHIPDPDKLKEVLENGLKKRHFTDIILEWVDCPNLTAEPFNLAVPHICGNTAVLDIGDLSYSRLEPEYNRMKKKYDIGKLLKNLNYNEKNFFIFGNGIAHRFVGSKQRLSELVMNQSFSPAVDRIDPDVNKNRFTYTLRSRSYCDVQMSENPDTVPLCYMKGTFFLCDEIASKVLKIYVKANSLIVESPIDFINSMQDALYEKHGKNGENVGGIYKVNNIHGWRHTVTPHYWKNLQNINKYIYCKVKSPEAIISIFNSGTKTRTPHCPGSPSIKFNAIESTHCLSHKHAHKLHEFYTNEVVEYTGYFSPAQKLFRVDEPITQAGQYVWPTIYRTLLYNK